LRKLIVWSLLVAVITFTSTIASSAPVMVVDRGLPTGNLNDAAGDNRSNVAWSQGNENVTGDTFTIGEPGETWVIDAIRTWSIGHIETDFGDEWSDVTLYLGTAGTDDLVPIATGTVTAGTNTNSNPNITHTPAQYVGNVDYEPANNPSARQIWQNDFTNLDITVEGGVTYYFAVDGITESYYWFNHASNATLSVSPQDGADDQYYTWDKSDLTASIACNSNGAIDGCDGGWDKSSDINVQVMAEQVVDEAPAPNFLERLFARLLGWLTLLFGFGAF
jgi:hypothetical protein